MHHTRSGGTRFSLFPQYDEGFAPEVVEVSSPAGSLGPGPRDRRMYVADALGKTRPYAPPDPAPPWTGPVHAPALPDPAGHFDSLPPDTSQFRAAHLFGTVRLVLDIWERLLGGPVPWWHPDASHDLELVPVVHWANAQSGPGFLETGLWPGPDGSLQPFCLNFDVVAHEVGHALLFGVMGVPSPDRLDESYLGFHESFGDLVALLSALHFPSVRARLLRQTAGDLYALNLLNRLAETAPHQQIRLACNSTTMQDVAGLRVRADGSWFDPAGLGRNAHALSEPLTGVVFDCLVELYQEGLVRRGAIGATHDVRGWSRSGVALSLGSVHDAHRRAYSGFAAAFDAALLDARDAVSAALVHVVRTLPAAGVTFGRVAALMLESVAHGGFASRFDSLLELFLHRGIEPRPHLWLAPVLGQRAVRASRRGARVLATQPVPTSCRCADPGHVALARRLMPHAHRSADRNVCVS